MSRVIILNFYYCIIISLSCFLNAFIEFFCYNLLSFSSIYSLFCLFFLKQDDSDSDVACRTSFEHHWKCLRRKYCTDLNFCNARCSGGDALSHSHRRGHRMLRESRSRYSIPSSVRSKLSHSPASLSPGPESDSDSELWLPMKSVSVSQVSTGTRLPSTSSSTSTCAAIGNSSGQMAEVIVETCADHGERIIQRIVVRGAGNSSAASASAAIAAQSEPRLQLDAGANTEAGCSRSCSHQHCGGHRHSHRCRHSHRHRRPRDSHCERGRRCRHAHSHHSHSSSACESSASASASGSESESCPSCSSATSGTSGSDCDTPSESDSDTRIPARDYAALGGRGRCSRRASARPSRAAFSNGGSSGTSSALRGQLSAIPEEAASYCSHRSNNSQFTRESPALTSAL